MRVVISGDPGSLSLKNTETVPIQDQALTLRAAGSTWGGYSLKHRGSYDEESFRVLPTGPPGDAAHHVSGKTSRCDEPPSMRDVGLPGMGAKDLVPADCCWFCQALLVLRYARSSYS